MTTVFEGEAIVVDRRDGVDWITLNRPDRLNAINPAMSDELADHFDALCDDDTVRVAVLRGAGRAFCAGLDIKARVSGENGDRTTARLPEVIRNMRRCPQPVVALVKGPACGGGFAFALAADIRIAGESARMNDAFVTLGISGCELGLSYFLPRHVGTSVAAELMYTGRFVDAQRAYQVGLVSEVVPDDELDAAGESMVADMLALAPMALRKTKETFWRAQAIDDLDEVLDLELATQKECMASADFQGRLRAFAERRHQGA